MWRSLLLRRAELQFAVVGAEVTAFAPSVRVGATIARPNAQNFGHIERSLKRHNPSRYNL